MTARLRKKDVNTCVSWSKSTLHNCGRTSMFRTRNPNLTSYISVLLHRTAARSHRVICHRVCSGLQGAGCYLLSAVSITLVAILPFKFKHDVMEVIKQAYHSNPDQFKPLQDAFQCCGADGTPKPSSEGKPAATCPKDTEGKVGQSHFIDIILTVAIS